MLERGIVKAIEGDRLIVTFKRSSACGSCKACGMLKDMSEVDVDVENTQGAAVGDRVCVEFSASNSLQSALIAYGIPFVMLLIGIFLGYQLQSWLFPSAEPDVVAALMGIALTALSFLIIRLFEPRMKKRNKNAFRLVSVEPGGQEGDGNDSGKDS